MPLKVLTVYFRLNARKRVLQCFETVHFLWFFSFLFLESEGCKHQNRTKLLKLCHVWFLVFYFKLSHAHCEWCS